VFQGTQLWGVAWCGAMSQSTLTSSHRYIITQVDRAAQHTTRLHADNHQLHQYRSSPWHVQVPCFAHIHQGNFNPHAIPGALPAWCACTQSFSIRTADAHEQELAVGSILAVISRTGSGGTVEASEVASCITQSRSMRAEACKLFHRQETYLT
jgi:hypothetical protein